LEDSTFPREGNRVYPPIYQTPWITGFSLLHRSTGRREFDEDNIPAIFVQNQWNYYDPISFNPGPKMLFVVYKSSGKRYSSIFIESPPFFFKAI